MYCHVFMSVDVHVVHDHSRIGNKKTGFYPKIYVKCW